MRLQFFYVSLLIAFVRSHPSTDLTRVLEPITDPTPRDHSLDLLAVRHDVVDEEVDRPAQNRGQCWISNIMSTGHNLFDAEEPVPAHRHHYSTRVVASDIITSTNEWTVVPQQVTEPLATGIDVAFYFQDRGLHTSLGPSCMASIINFVEPNSATPYMFYCNNMEFNSYCTIVSVCHWE